MKLSMKTAVFQEAVGRAIKGASRNKLMPLTSLMAIIVKDGQLKLITTDATNYLYILHDVAGAEDFYAVVQAEQFAKLISKLTSENITLELTGNILNVKANGAYKIELPLDENGNAITYPDPVQENKIEGEPIAEINLATIKAILSTNKAALAVTMEEPVYTGYYVADRVISTDSYKICELRTKVFDNPVLIPPEMMNLLEIMTAEKIAIYDAEDILEFVSDDCIVYGFKLSNIEDYAIEGISALLDTEFDYHCTVNKADLLALLDRISLFVGQYDNKAITLAFTPEGLCVSSKQSNGTEVIPYIDSVPVVDPFTCMIDIVQFTQQVKANESESICIQYGNDSSIKIVTDNITQVIALLEDV